MAVKKVDGTDIWLVIDGEATVCLCFDEQQAKDIDLALDRYYDIPDIEKD